MVCRKDDDNNNPPLSGEETKGNENKVGTGPSKKSPVPSKKGPWTSEEDAILTDYIKKHGRGNWNAVKEFSGLSRCGKSCRLRWVNHLQSDLKKGPITPEEEDIIVRLHAMIGPKWARIAAELPGRTDNEVKNFFNTRKKRLQRAGLEIYPKDVLNQNQYNESQQSPISGTLSNELSSSHNLMEAAVSDIPVFRVAGSLCSELYSSMFIGSNVLPHDPIPSCGIHHPAPTMQFQKRLRESDASPALSDTATSSLFTQLNCNAQFQHHQPCELPPLPESVFGDNSYLQAFLGSHAFINGTYSTSSPSFGSARLELPSLQSSDTLLQSPQVRPSQSHGIPDTDGLLESLVRPSKKVATDPTENETTGDWDNILADISDPDWEALLADSNPPIVSSTAAIFSDLTITGLSFDDLQPNSDVLASDANPETPPTSTTSSNPNQNVDSDQQDSWRPDSWLNANLLSPDTEFGKEYLVLQEAISALKGDEHNLQQ